MNNLLNALKRRYEADIACAKANISVYVEHPVGIGEHSDLVGAIDGEVEKLCNSEEKLKALESHFGKPF